MAPDDRDGADDAGGGEVGEGGEDGAATRHDAASPSTALAMAFRGAEESGTVCVDRPSVPALPQEAA